jgi:hypothetical protein
MTTASNDLRTISFRAIKRALDALSSQLFFKMQTTYVFRTVKLELLVQIAKCQEGCRALIFQEVGM